MPSVMPWLLLSFGLLSMVNALSSLWPPRWPAPLGVLAFAFGWPSSESPLMVIALNVFAAVLLVALGGLGSPMTAPAVSAGWVGLALVLSSIALLSVHLFIPRAVAEIADRALRDGLGDDYRRLVPADIESSIAHGPVARVGALPKLPRDVERCGRDIVYRADGRRPATLDVYRHVSRSTDSPVFLYVHGGAWVFGNKRQQGLTTIHRMASLGWTCVTINYCASVRSTFPEHIIDVKHAIKWIRQHGHEYGANPDFIIIGGGSAGGHLASLAALTPGADEYQRAFLDVDTAVRGCVSFYGVYDLADRDGVWPHRMFVPFVERVVMKLSAREAPEAFDKASPMHRIHADAPPFLVIHGTADSVVPVESARLFVDRLRDRSHAPVCYVELPYTQHAFENLQSPRSRAVTRAVARFCTHVHARYLADRKRAPADTR